MLKKFWKQTLSGLAITSLIMGIIWGGIQWDGSKADASEVKQIQKDLATLTKLVTQDKVMSSIRSCEAQIIRMDQEYKNKPMSAAELQHYLFLKGHLAELMQLKKGSK